MPTIIHNILFNIYMSDTVNVAQFWEVNYLNVVVQFLLQSPAHQGPSTQP